MYLRLDLLLKSSHSTVEFSVFSVTAASSKTVYGTLVVKCCHALRELVRQLRQQKFVCTAARHLTCYNISPAIDKLPEKIIKDEVKGVFFIRN